MAAKENIISPTRAERHNISRYDFKTLTPNETRDVVQETKDTPFKIRRASIEELGAESGGQAMAASAPAQPATSQPQSTPAQQPATHFVPAASPLDKELFDKLITKTEELSGRVAGMQENFDRQRQELEQRAQDERQAAYEQGYEKGKIEATKEVENRIEEVKAAFSESVINLNKRSEDFDKSISSLEKELSSIAIDIAREVIIAEVEEKGSEIAHALATELMENIKDASKATIKLNPQDYDFVKERLPEDTRIHIEKDKAIAKGGVVIISDSGNIDGTVMARYHTLKTAILESQQE